VKEAISQLAVDRANLGAVQARLNFSHEQLTVTQKTFPPLFPELRILMWQKKPPNTQNIKFWYNQALPCWRKLTLSHKLPFNYCSKGQGASGGITTK